MFVIVRADRDWRPMSWVTCNNDIFFGLKKDHPVSSVPALNFLVDHIK
jgi:hypothetical protein